MDEELLFEYPVKEDREELKIQMIQGAKKNDHSALMILILSLFGLTSIALHMLFSSSAVRLILVLAGTVMILLALKIIASLKDRAHDITAIDAFETHMDIEVYMTNGGTSKLHIKYEDIRLCYLSKQFDSVQFLYDSNKESYQELIDSSGKKTDVLEGKFTCPISPGYTQLFFLYLARQCFDIHPGGKEIVKRFGLKEEYIRKYIGE